MHVPNLDLKEAIIQILDDLPDQQVAEVLDFALFLKQRKEAKEEKDTHMNVKSLPASTLDPLIGLVAWGGDAVVDSERLYSDE